MKSIWKKLRTKQRTGPVGTAAWLAAWAQVLFLPVKFTCPCSSPSLPLSVSQMPFPVWKQSDGETLSLLEPPLGKKTFHTILRMTKEVKIKRAVSRKPEEASVVGRERSPARLLGALGVQGYLSMFYSPRLSHSSGWCNSGLSLFPTAPWSRQPCSSPFLCRNPGYLASLTPLELCYAQQRVQFPPCFPLVRSLVSMGNRRMKSCPEVGALWCWPRPASQGCHSFSLTGRGEIYGHLMAPENQEPPGAGCQACEPAGAAPRARAREAPLSPHRANDTGQSVVRVQFSITEQVFCKPQLPCKYTVFDSERQENKLQAIQKPFENFGVLTLQCLLMLGIHSEFPRNAISHIMSCC